MYLSKIELDWRHPSIRQALYNCQDMHRNIMHYFDTTRKDGQILYRLDEGKSEVNVYVLSKAKPKENDGSGMKLIDSNNIDFFIDSLTNGKVLGFNINAMPTKKVKVSNEKNSKRRLLRLPEERLEWMGRHAEQNGFELIDCVENKQIRYNGAHGKNHPMWQVGYNYQGHLIINDEQLFKLAYCSGIGAGKSYGFGMLLLR